MTLLAALAPSGVVRTAPVPPSARPPYRPPYPPPPYRRTHHPSSLANGLRHQVRITPFFLLLMPVLAFGLWSTTAHSSAVLGDDPALKVFAGMGLSLVVIALMNTGIVTMPNVSTFDDLLGLLLPMLWLLLLTPTLIVAVVHGASWRRQYQPVRNSEVRAAKARLIAPDCA